MKYENNVPLKDYTTLHIGGPAARMAEPENLEEMRQVLQDAKENGQRLFILGKGSNVLFEDEGFDGVILHIPESFSKIERLDGNRIRVQAGATNGQVAAFCAENGLSGYEFACGVPGTIGGAVFMNAGCYNGETKDILESVRWLDEDGNLQESTGEDLDLGYRHSRFTDSFGLIVDAVYQLQPGDPAEIQKKIEELQEKRYAKQPMDARSCGSTFKRPEGSYASLLIDQAGLRGYRVGDAMVSEKHTGFLINAGNCTEKEFSELIRQVQQIVKESSGFELECEVRRVPYKG